MKGFPGLYLVVTGFIWTMLAVNALNVLTSLPVVLVLLATDLGKSWPLAAIVSPLVGLSFAGTCAAFYESTVNGSSGIVRAYLTGWRRGVRRVLPVAIGLAASAVVVGIDVAVLGRWGIGPVGLVAACLLTVVTVPVAAVAWVGLVERPDLRRVDILKVSAYLAVRRGGWSVASLTAIAVAAAALAANPVLGLGLVLAPALYIVWGNSRRILTEFVGDADGAYLADEVTAFGRA